MDKMIQGFKGLLYFQGHFFSLHDYRLWKNLHRTAKCLPPAYLTGYNISALSQIEELGRLHLGGVPDPNCNCGIHAVRLLDDLYQYNYEYIVWEDRQHDLRAIVVLLNLWGKIIEHDRGYRAQEAEITGVILPRCRYCSNKATQKIEYESYSLYCCSGHETIVEELKRDEFYSHTDIVDTWWYEKVAEETHLPLLEPSGEGVSLAGH